MKKQKSEVAQLLRQNSLEYEAAARGLISLSTGSARHSSITARVELFGDYNKQLASVITKMSRYCKNRLSRVQYNIDVVKRTQKQQVIDAV